jgi:hypothetical protein
MGALYANFLLDDAYDIAEMEEKANEAYEKDQKAGRPSSVW